MLYFLPATGSKYKENRHSLASHRTDVLNDQVTSQNVAYEIFGNAVEEIARKLLICLQAFQFIQESCYGSMLTGSQRI